MTEWITVHSSQSEEPKEFDTKSSSFFVYQRRNVKRVEVYNVDDVASELWEYEERKMSRDEYAFMMSERNAELENELTSLQLALCELYETTEAK